MGVRAVSGKVSGKPAWQVCWTVRKVCFCCDDPNDPPSIQVAPKCSFSDEHDYSFSRLRTLSWQQFAYACKWPHTDLPFNRFFDEEEHWDREAIE